MTFHGGMGPYCPYAISTRIAPGSQPPFPYWTRPSDGEDRIPRFTRQSTFPRGGSALTASPAGESHQQLPAQNNSAGFPKSSRPCRCDPKYRCLLLRILDVGPVPCAKPITMHVQKLLRGWFASISGPGVHNPGNEHHDRRRPGPSRLFAVPLLRDDTAPGSCAPP